MLHEQESLMHYKLPVGDSAYPLRSSTSAAPQSLSVIIRHTVFWCTC
jgi:hypothetical protein